MKANSDPIPDSPSANSESPLLNSRFSLSRVSEDRAMLSREATASGALPDIKKPEDQVRICHMLSHLVHDTNSMLIASQAHQRATPTALDSEHSLHYLSPSCTGLAVCNMLPSESCCHQVETSFIWGYGSGLSIVGLADHVLGSNASGVRWG